MNSSINHSLQDWPFDIEAIEGDRLRVAINKLLYQECFGHISEITKKRLFLAISESLAVNEEFFSKRYRDIWPNIQYKRVWIIEKTIDNWWESHVDNYIIKINGKKYFCKVTKVNWDRPTDWNGYDELMMLKSIHNSDLYEEIKKIEIEWLKIKVLQPVMWMYDQEGQYSAIIYPYIHNFKTGEAKSRENGENVIKTNKEKIEQVFDSLDAKIMHKWHPIREFSLTNTCFVQGKHWEDSTLYIFDPNTDSFAKER